MIDALLIDWLENGALPIYPVEGVWEDGGGEQYHLGEDFVWEGRFGRNRLLVGLTLDTTLAEMEDGLWQWIHDLCQFVGNAPGTLVCAVRGCYQLEGVAFVSAGLGFVTGVLAGAVPLEGADPTTMILTDLRGLVGQDSDTLHPVIRASLQRRLLARQEAEVQRQADAEAKERSRILLELFLHPDQLSEFREHGHFHVSLSDGRKFRFSPGFGHNVHLLGSDGSCITEYCIITGVAVPLYDQLLAQKVMLEVLPDEFFRIANRRDVPQVLVPETREFLTALVEACAP